MNRPPHEPLDPTERELARRLAQLDAKAAPSPALDAAILATARAEAGGSGAPPHAWATRPTRGRPLRWPVGFGIAASLALALGVAWQLRPVPDAAIERPSELPSRATPAIAPANEPPQAVLAPAPAAAEPGREEDVAPAAGSGSDSAPASAATHAQERPARKQEPATTVPSAPAAEAERAAAAEREAREAAARADRAIAERAAAERAAAIVAPPAPPSPPAPVPSPAPPPLEPAVAQPEAAADLFVPPPPPPPPAGAAPTAIDQAAAGQRMRQAVPAPAAPPRIDMAADQPFDDEPPASADSPGVREAWLQRIRELRDDGRLDEARASLQEFVRRHPQATVPDDLRPLLDR